MARIGRAYAKAVARPLVRRLLDGAGDGPAVRVYAAHDTTLMPLLVALGAGADGRWAPYASAIILETWASRGGGSFIRVAYDGAALSAPEPLAAFEARNAWARRPRDCAGGALATADARAPPFAAWTALLAAAFAAGAGAAVGVGALLSRRRDTVEADGPTGRLAG